MLKKDNYIDRYRYTVYKNLRAQICVYKGTRFVSQGGRCRSGAALYNELLQQSSRLLISLWPQLPHVLLRLSFSVLWRFRLLSWAQGVPRLP